MKAMTSRKVGLLKSDVTLFVTELLEKINGDKTIMQFQKNETVFCQGDQSEAIYFIQSGKVKIAVVSAAGKEAVLTVLGPRIFR